MLKSRSETLLNYILTRSNTITISTILWKQKHVCRYVLIWYNISALLSEHFHMFFLYYTVVIICTLYRMAHSQCFYQQQVKSKIIKFEKFTTLLKYNFILLDYLFCVQVTNIFVRLLFNYQDDISSIFTKTYNKMYIPIHIYHLIYANI